MIFEKNPHLLHEFQLGKTEALDQVFHAYADHVAQLVRRGFGYYSGGRRQRFTGFSNRADVQDLVAEVFRAAFEDRARNGYRAQGPYGAYLRSITRNLIIDHLRENQRAPISLEEVNATTELPFPVAMSPEDSVETGRMQIAVRDFLKDASTPERELIQLRYMEDLSQRDTAEALGVTRRYVRTVEVKLRRRLVRHLKRCGSSAARAA